MLATASVETVDALVALAIRTGVDVEHDDVPSNTTTMAGAMTRQNGFSGMSLSSTDHHAHC